MIVKEAKKQNTKPVDFDRSKSPVITLTLIMGCILLCWLFVVTYLPDSTLFQRPASNFTADTAGYIVPEAGDVFEEQFTMPYDRLFSININWDKADLTASTPIDADLHLLCGDQVVCSKKIVTPNDIFTIPKNTQISKGTEYTFRLVINRNDGEAKLMVPAEAKGTSAPAMSINGNNYGAGASFFTIVFLLSAALACIAVYLHSRKKNELTPVTDRFDKIVIGLVLLESILLISQFFDLFCIARSGDMLLSIDRPIHQMYDYLYEASVADAASDYRMLHNYSPLLYLLLLPLSIPFRILAPNADPFYRYSRTALWMKIPILLLLILAAYLLNKLLKRFEVSEEQRKTSLLLFFTSSFIIYSVVGFGQFDIIYICLILWAMLYFGKGSNRIFSLIISVGIAVKTLPVVVFIPLLLLYNKKIRDIVINLGIALSVPALMHLIFCRSASYGVFQDIVALDIPFDAYLIGETTGSISFFVLFYAFICLICYFIDISGKNSRGFLITSSLTILSVYTDMMIFMIWHSQWITMFSIAFSILLPFYARKRALNLAGIVLEALLLIKCMFREKGIHMITYGLATFSKVNYQGTAFPRIAYNLSPYTNMVVTSMASGIAILLLIYMIIQNPELSSESTLFRFISERFPGRFFPAHHTSATAVASGTAAASVYAAESDTASDSKPEEDLPKIAILARLLPFQGLMLFFIWCYCFIG